MLTVPLPKDIARPCAIIKNLLIINHLLMQLAFHEYITVLYVLGGPTTLKKSLIYYKRLLFNLLNRKEF